MKTTTARALLITAAALLAALLLIAAGFAAGRVYSDITAPRIECAGIYDDPICDREGSCWHDPETGKGYDYRIVIWWTDGTVTEQGGWVF